MKASKAEWIERLGKLKADPRPLTPTECTELVALLGGGKPHRPVKLTKKGESEREARAMTLADWIFDPEYDGLSRAEAIRRFAKETGWPAKAVENELSWLRERLGLACLDARSWVAYRDRWINLEAERLGFFQHHCLPK